MFKSLHKQITWSSVILPQIAGDNENCSKPRNHAGRSAIITSEANKSILQWNHTQKKGGLSCITTSRAENCSRVGPERIRIFNKGLWSQINVYWQLVSPQKLHTRHECKYIFAYSGNTIYPWVNLYEWGMNETSLTGTVYPHRYCILSRVLRIWLTGTAYPHRYCISSRVPRIWLTGIEDMTHGQCISSRVLRIWLTGTEDMTHRYWGYDSRIMNILTGATYVKRFGVGSWNLWLLILIYGASKKVISSSIGYLMLP